MADDDKSDSNESNHDLDKEFSDFGVYITLFYLLFIMRFIHLYR